MRLEIRWEHGRLEESALGSRSQISGQDALLLLEIIQECLSVETSDCMRQTVFPAIQKLFPFELYGAELGGLVGPGGAIATTNHFPFNLPGEFCREYLTRKLLPFDAGTVHHFTTYEPQYWCVSDTGVQKRPESLQRVLPLCMEFGIEGGYSYGCKIQTPGAGGSMFTFLGRATKYDPRTFAILERLVPHLHLALLRVAKQEPKTPVAEKNVLSGRELQVLDWLKEGKSSWDISRVLGISERTTNFHVYNLLQKLGAINRSQAVAIAIRQGIISLY